MVVCVAMDQLPLGGHHVQADDVLASQPPDTAVPAVSALQQVAAEAHALAVPGGKEEILGLQLTHQDAAALARPDDGDMLVDIDGGVVDPLDVDQHRPIAKVVGRPTVGPRTEC